MQIKFSKSFSQRLNDQVDYIANDKPIADRKFKSEIIARIKQIPQVPYSNRKSVFFNRNDIRDLIYKGYVVVYKINEVDKSIEVFGFVKWEENSF